MTMMTREAFVPRFEGAVVRLGRTELITKEVVRQLSRDLLVAFHFSDPQSLKGDVQFINRFLSALSPVNRRAAKVFFQSLGGLHYDDKVNLFTKVSKKRAIPAREAAQKFLSDPNASLWTWQRDNIAVEKAPRPVAEKVASYIKGALKDGSQEDILRGVFAGGVSILAAERILAEMVKAQADAEAQAEKAQPAPAPF